MTTVALTTSLGRIRIELDDERAPMTVDNFLQYVRAGHYDGTLFHRVIPGFMVQGGGFDESMRQKPTRGGIRNEAGNGLTNQIYTVAMARTNDPHSATSQFFVNVADNGFLNHQSPTPRGYGYTVFGRVVEGTEVVDEIVTKPTGSRGGHDDVPVDPIVIQKAEEETPAA